MTPLPDQNLRDRLATPTVPERDLAFSRPVLGRLGRDRRRGLGASLAWAMFIAAVAGLLAAAAYMGGEFIIELTIRAMAAG